MKNPAQGAEADVARDGAYAWYVAAVMAMCQAVSFIDRQLINLLIGPIKADYNLSDTSVSLLIGLAFSAVHVLLAIPIGRWIDRGNVRVTIFVCGIAWSISAMAGGVVHSYSWLFASRMGVGAAEAGVYTACATMVAAYFSPAKLPRAMSISLLGPFVGGGLSLIFGGLVIGALEKIGPQTFAVVGMLKPWQMTLVIISAAGILPILLVLTVREPVSVRSGREKAEPLGAAIAYLRSNRQFYMFFYAGIMLHVMAVYAIPAWAPSLLVRRFDLPLSAVGIRFGTVALAAGVGGMLCGPWLAGLMGGAVKGIRFAVLATGLLALGLPWTATVSQTLALLFAIIFCTTLPLPLASAILMASAPVRLRGFVGSIYFVVSGLVGLALAPTLTGLLTDYVFHDPNKVGSAMAVVLGAGGIASFALFMRMRLVGEN